MERVVLQEEQNDGTQPTNSEDSLLQHSKPAVYQSGIGATSEQAHQPTASPE